MPKLYSVVLQTHQDTIMRFTMYLFFLEYSLCAYYYSRKNEYTLLPLRNVTL